MLRMPQRNANVLLMDVASTGHRLDGDFQALGHLQRALGATSSRLVRFCGDIRIGRRRRGAKRPTARRFTIQCHREICIEKNKFSLCLDKLTDRTVFIKLTGRSEIMRKPEKLDELLIAAHNVVMRDGVARLTLELVAREAGVSKGAVLYYFPTKNALIGEMLKTHLERNRQQWMACLAEEPEGVPGRVTRAWIRSVRALSGVKAHEGAGMLAAIANDPALLSIIHERIAVWKKELEDDGLPPERLQVIRYAMDGIKFCELMGMDAPCGASRDQLIDYLLKMATPGASL